jgi:hypothetical protein
MRKHHDFLSSHKTEPKIERLILDDCKKKLVEDDKGVAEKMKGYPASRAS